MKTLLVACLLLGCFPVVMRAQDDSTTTAADSDAREAREDDDALPSAEDVLEGLRLTPSAFRMAAAKVEPSLVTIESFGGSTAIEGQIGGIRRQGEGNSTGVLISSDGFIVTSTFSFIRQPPVIMVSLSDGTRHVAKLIGRDDTRRIALLKIDATVDLPIPEMIPADEVMIGQWAISVGVGYGDTNPAVSMGIVSAKNRIGGRALQTDANISPANYGGPLVDIEGRLMGICVPMSPNSQDAGAGVEWYDSGIGFAVPLAGNERILEKLKNGETIRPGFLGIQMRANEDEQPGVVIESVLEETPAAAAGLQENDVILKVNGEEVVDLAQLRRTIRSFIEGDEVTIVYSREGEESEIQITLGAPQSADE